MVQNYDGDQNDPTFVIYHFTIQLTGQKSGKKDMPFIWQTLRCLIFKQFS